MLKFIVLYFFLSFSFLIKGQFNYGHQMDFGKNRIQYKNFDWAYLDFDRFRIYSYQGADELAKYASVVINKELQIIEKRLDYQFNDKINVLVYSTQADFKQSNLGLNSDIPSNIGGVTNITGNKINVFFNGSHTQLDQQIRAALAQLIINKIMYGGSAREMIQSATLLNLPDWYLSGLVKYLSEGWSSYADNLLYDDLKIDVFNHFNRIKGAHSTQVGQAIWYYIVSNYGESIIPNLLYMSKIQRSVDNALLYTIGLPLSDLINDFSETYNRRFYTFKDSLRKSIINNNSILKKYKENKHYYQLKLSSDAKNVIYSINELNKIKIYKKNIEKNTTQLIHKYYQKVEELPDYNYPLLGWHPTKNISTMIYEFKNQIYLQLNDHDKNEVVRRNFPGFEKVNSFSYSNDGKKIVISAVKKGKGQSDIFLFTLNNSGIEQLTNDIWDDNNPIFMKDSKQIVFESNRNSDTLNNLYDASYFSKINRNSDLFMVSESQKNKLLVRITSTPDINETQPQPYLNNYITYLSDKNGIYNRYLAQFDSSISFIDTTEHYQYFFNSKAVSNIDRNILEQHINVNCTHVAEVIYANGKDMMLLTPLQNLNNLIEINPTKTWHKSTVNTANIDPSNYSNINLSKELKIEPVAKSETEIDFENYIFDNEKKTLKYKSDSINKLNKKIFKFPILQNYYTSFYTDYVVTQFDNSFLGNNYQKFSGGGSPIYLNPGFNFLTRISISDLMEDQKISAGFRINPNLDNEFILAWEQRKRLTDHQLIFDRQVSSEIPVVLNNGNSFFTKIKTHTIKYSIKYPFSPVACTRLSFLYRNDNSIPLSNNDFSLNKTESFENLGGIRLEYIFDNTRNIMLNILNGFRFKIWTEYWKYTDGGTRDLFTSGFDARHYQKIHREMILCNRLAGGNSLGSDRLIFYLGGVDNSVAPSFNSNINIIKPEQYGFQTLATNMRGFNQNIRNGNNFLVFNTELRIPVIKYFLNKTVNSDFFNNLQVIGFTDFGMAWYGSNPLSTENTQNSVSFIDQDQYTGNGSTGIIIKVINDKSPLVGGIGFGFRSKLFGYFVRLDFGYGIEDFIIQKRIVGLSFATDF